MNERTRRATRGTAVALPIWIMQDSLHMLQTSIAHQGLRALRISSVRGAFCLIAAVMISVMVGCDSPGRSGVYEATPEASHQDLLVGYGLLADTLSKESRLAKLDLFKTLMLDAPNDAVAKLMKLLSEASERRAAELDELRPLAPDVSGKPATKSPIGDAISDVVQDFSKSEMLSRAGGFDVRFVLVQAQATRMVTAMATATARFDPNPRRKAWLTSVAHEYEGYRHDLIKYLAGRDCSAAQ